MDVHWVSFGTIIMMSGSIDISYANEEETYFTEFFLFFFKPHW